MTELLTAAQMRAVEQAAIASGEVTGLELMERAGRGVVEAIFEEWPELKATSHRAVVLCGPGNNGGDGFVVARLLKEWGWEAEVFLYGDPERMPPDAGVNYERWRGMGEVEAFSDADLDLDGTWRIVDKINAIEPRLLFDALFGIGLSRPVSQGLQSLFHVMDMQIRMDRGDRTRLVSIDIPSGACADSGVGLDEHEDRWADHNIFRAHLTVAFETPKPGHFLEECPEYCGKLVVKQLGLQSAWRVEEDRARLTDLKWRNAFWPQAALSKQKQYDHKYLYGHALILSGPPGHTGAARLAARGALRIGAGLVTVGAEPEAIPEHAAHLTTIMLRAVADGAALADVMKDQRINALCLGPALGLDDRACGLLAAALVVDEQRVAPGPAGGGSGAARRAAGRNLVLDADALTILSQNPDLFAALHEGCVLTPHAGEFARLFPDIAEKLAAPATKGPAYSKVDATREAAKRAGCVVLYKGPDTVIADPSGRCSINSAHYDRAAPWLATAGSGDVLAGFITGLLARGFTPMEAAETAAWLHVECARKFGPGLIAEDLPEQLPAVFRDLEL